MALQDGFLDGLVPVAEDLGRRRSDADRMNLAAWDASAGVRRDALADECRGLRLPVAVAGKSVVPELVCLGPDAQISAVSADRAAVPLLLAVLPLALAEPDKPAADPSAAQSCAALAVADG